MQLMTSMRREGIQEGIQQGLHDGKEGIVARLIRKRFGSVSPKVSEQLNTLSADELDDIAEALLDFASVVDLEAWLVRHQPN